MYIVVVFKQDRQEDETVALVPSSWVINKREAHWPPYKSSSTITKAVRDGLNPDTETWTLFPMRVMCACSKYMQF